MREGITERPKHKSDINDILIIGTKTQINFFTYHHILIQGKERDIRSPDRVYNMKYGSHFRRPWTVSHYYLTVFIRKYLHPETRVCSIAAGI